jgi:endo-alpha-1,4-polygalactosaminidase (GH114 family)
MVLALVFFGCSDGGNGKADGDDGADVSDGADIDYDYDHDYDHDHDQDHDNDAGDDAGNGDDGGGDEGGDEAQQVWQPGPGTSWQWQLTGTVDTSIDVVMYDIDLFDVPQATIDSLHADGRIVICYFSAGSREDWRPDEGDFPQQAIGNRLDNWPGENWIDIRDATVRGIMQARMDLAVTKNCDGVEPDNVDAYTNNSGFNLTAADQLDYNRFLAAEAHARGLSVGLKNDLDQVNDLLDDFDWALNEECFDWNECDMLLPFIQAGKAVFHVEYGDAQLAQDICPQANALDFDSLIKNYDLDAWRIPCR